MPLQERNSQGICKLVGTAVQPIYSSSATTSCCQGVTGEILRCVLFQTDNGQTKHFACSLGSPCATDDQEINQLVSRLKMS